jgi:hypothetical protein
LREPREAVGKGHNDRSAPDADNEAERLTGGRQAIERIALVCGEAGHANEAPRVGGDEDANKGEPEIRRQRHSESNRQSSVGILANNNKGTAASSSVTGEKTSTRRCPLVTLGTP